MRRTVGVTNEISMVVTWTWVRGTGWARGFEEARMGVQEGSLYALFLLVRAKRVQGESGERRGRFDPGVSWLRASGGDGRQAHFATLPLSLRASAPALSAALPLPPTIPSGQRVFLSSKAHLPIYCAMCDSLGSHWSKAQCIPRCTFFELGAPSYSRLGQVRT